jgi:hypothetical protein
MTDLRRRVDPGSLRPFSSLGGIPEGSTRAWPVAFESVWETKCERSSGTGLCLFGYSLVASTNSAASIHLPVPVVTDPQHALGLTRIFLSRFAPGCARCAWGKGMRDTQPDHPSRRALATVQIAHPRPHYGMRRTARWPHIDFQPNPKRFAPPSRGPGTWHKHQWTESVTTPELVT